MSKTSGRTKPQLLQENEGLRERLAAAERRGQRLAETSSQLLANISHELRTPMAGILGMVDLALRAELNATVRDFLQTAKASAGELMQLLNQLLDFSQLAAHKLPLEEYVFDLRTSLETTLKTLRLRALEKGLELIYDLPEDLPNQLVGDPLRLHQVLTNLVGNAIKFTIQGEIAVRVSRVPLSTEDDPPAIAPAVVLHFAVSDTGIGVAAEDQERIFTPFTQADNSTTRPYGGTGLGLAIAARLVHLMHGQTWVDSESGRGSTFHFTARFPLGDESATRLPAQGPARNAAAWRPLRILVVEDMPANQKLAAAILGERGHAVRIAPHGRAALAAVQEYDVDVVLMDIQMPIMDGFQATAAIRALPDPAKARLPIVAVTAYAMAHDRARCLAAGMDAYVMKPVVDQELIELVERLAQPAARSAAPAANVSEPRLAQPARPAALVDPAEPPFVLAAAMKQLGGRENLFREMVAYLGTQTSEVFVQIRRAQGAGDAESLARAAHALKGTLIYLGAAPAVAAAQRAERLARAGDLAAATPACQDLEQEIARLQIALKPYQTIGCPLPRLCAAAGVPCH